jgi:hypothetical protein
MYQQHSELPQAAASFPLSQVWIIYEAQPTPGVTEMASAGQFFAQAPHSIQPSKSSMRVFFPLIENIPCGQTTAHIPQPTQDVSLSRNVVTPVRYRNVSIVKNPI